MPFKDLEHDGNEEYVDRSFSNREVVDIDERKRKKQQQDDKKRILDEKQEKWLNPMNPFLWSGDADI